MNAKSEAYTTAELKYGITTPERLHHKLYEGLKYFRADAWYSVEKERGFYNHSNRNVNCGTTNWCGSDLRSSSVAWPRQHNHCNNYRWGRHIDCHLHDECGGRRRPLQRSNRDNR